MLSRLIPILLLVLPSIPGAASPSPTRLLGERYPLEVSFAAHAGLLHWLDSLTGLQGTGTTGGKTVPAHRQQFSRMFGELRRDDRRQLKRFAQVRQRAVHDNRLGEVDALTAAFLETSTLDQALRAAARVLEPAELEPLQAALRHFEPQYRRVWQDGALPRAFLDQTDPRLAERLALFLVDLAAFYGVDPTRLPAPRVHLMPVIDGHGTHAQAVGRHLLIEIRMGEGLIDQLPPIVHENAHFLYHRMEAAQRRALNAVVAARGEIGALAWRELIEALPTALAQGVAAQRFQGRRWSTEAPWYHRPEIDRYAKRLFPLVQRTLAAGGRFDTAFLEQAIDAYREPPVTRR